MSSRALALGLLLLHGAATPALGHVGLETSDPEAAATVSGVDSVTLVFNEPLDTGVSSFKLVGPDGSTIGTGAVTGPRRMALDALALEPGEFSVKWTAAGEDGHIERGRLSFTVEAASATAAPATPNTAATPDTAATPGPSDGLAQVSQSTGTRGATPVASPAAPAANAATAAAADSAADVLVPIVAGLAVVGLVGLLLLRRSRTA